jgi:hypothetical protein
MNTVDNYSTQIAFVQLLTEATKRGVLSWLAMEGDCYRSIDRRYGIDWLYWYDSTGITIGRVGLLISDGHGRIANYTATELFEHCQRLLEAIDLKWLEHQRRLELSCATMIGPERQTCDSSIPSTTAMLRALLTATISNPLHWTRCGNSWWKSAIEEQVFEIRLRSPMDLEEVPLPEVLAEVSIPGANFAFIEGTDGFELIKKILYQVDPEQRAKADREAEQLNKAISALRELLGDNS